MHRLKRIFSPARILALVDQEEIDRYFASLDGEEGLQTVDPEIVEMLLEQLNQTPQPQQIEQTIKTDILTLGEKELLAACRDEGLIGLFEYMSTIKNHSHKAHSYYGHKLINFRPEKYYLGKKSTHYHCKTTARRIEEEYGIFRDESEEERSNEPQVMMNQADEEFIAKEGSDSGEDKEEGEDQVEDNEEEEEEEEELESPVPARRSKNQQKQQKRSKMMLDSQSEQPISTHRKKKMQLDSQSQSSSSQPLKKQQAEDERILSTLSSLSTDQILGNFTYLQLFEYLLEHRRDQLLSLMSIEQVSLTVLTNRGTNKHKKKTSSGRKLMKAKVNLKTLTLSELVEVCREVGLKEVAKIHSIDLLTGEDHLKFSKLLVKHNPKKYVMEGSFNAYPDEETNQAYEQIYQNQEDAQSEGDEEDGSDDEYSEDIVVNDSASIESEQDELDRAEAAFRKRRR